MSIKPLVTMGKLEDNPVWQEGCAIAEYMYGILHQLPEEEKWDTERKIRSAANDVMYYIAQAVANGLPSSAEYDWANARKHISALKTLYRFAGRQKMIDLDPAVMVRLDKLMQLLDKETENAYVATEAYNKKDLEMWRKKYELGKSAEREVQK